MRKIGSGATESANKVVVEARLKGPGMHWASFHLNPMLAFFEEFECQLTLGEGLEGNELSTKLTQTLSTQKTDAPRLETIT